MTSNSPIRIDQSHQVIAFSFNRVGIAIGSIACAFVLGCSTSSISMPSNLGNNLHLEQNTRAEAISIPTDNTKPSVAVFVGNVECNALVTGRPLELGRHVKNSVVQYLVSSKNFAVLESSGAARYVIGIKISSFERGIKTQSEQHSTDVVFESGRGEEKRRGILELQVAVTDAVSGKLIHSFAANSQTEDITSTTKSGLLGFNSVGQAYHRRPDNEVVSEAAKKVALELWARLINQTEPLSHISKQQ